MNTSRRALLRGLGLGAVALGLHRPSAAAEPIQGFEQQPADAEALKQASKGWKPISGRKIRVGLVGHGVCKFAATFGFQDHPNVEVIAVSDLFPDRCAALAKAARCDRTYPSLEEMVKDDRIEAIFLATDAPSHAHHAMEVLKHDKHVAVAVPACFGSMEEAERLFEATKTARGLKYMMFETSCYHEDLHAMRTIYDAGGFGKIVFAEGEYYHYSSKPLGSYKGWRVGLPPMWYPTHSTAYYVGVTGGTFTEVSCMGFPSEQPHHRPENNPYKNSFATEVALFRTSDGGSARMVFSKDTPGFGGERGRVRGQKGSFDGQYSGQVKDLPDTRRPPIPPGLEIRWHGGSHGPLTEEFVNSILQDRKPLVDIIQALNMTVGGIVAHESALKDGELMRVPQFS